MALYQRNDQTVQTTLNQAVYQQLFCLQMPATQLADHVQEAFLGNPLLAFDEAEETLPAVKGSGSDIIRLENAPSSHWDIHAYEDRNVTEPAEYRKSYTDHLTEQLGQLRGLDKNTAALCRYIINSLDPNGYLDCPISTLAQELDVPLFLMQQALFIVQMLDPIGSGARDLSECLVLQLAQKSDFNELDLHMAKYGLAELAKCNYSKLAKMFGTGLAQVKASAEVLRSLNPIPSQGFSSSEETEYIIPEASIEVDGESIVISVNGSASPRIKLDEYYCSLMNDANYTEAQEYLKGKLDDAKNLISGLEFRRSTVIRVLETVVAIQKDFFLNGAALKPITMSELSDELGLSVSTVSRAIKDKYVMFGCSPIALKDLLSQRISNTLLDEISADKVKAELLSIIKAENKEKPLTDEMISKLLSEKGIYLSRRTVAKYRYKANIPPASQRRRRK